MPKNGVSFSCRLGIAPFATLSQLSCSWKSKACFIRIQWSEIHGDTWRSLAVKWSTIAWGGPSDNDRLLGRLRCKLSTEKFFQIPNDTSACHLKEALKESRRLLREIKWNKLLSSTQLSSNHRRRLFFSFVTSEKVLASWSYTRHGLPHTSTVKVSSPCHLTKKNTAPGWGREGTHSSTYSC